MDTRNTLIQFADAQLSKEDSTVEDYRTTIRLLQYYIKEIHTNPTHYIFEKDHINKVNAVQGDEFLENEVEAQIDSLKRLHKIQNYN